MLSEYFSNPLLNMGLVSHDNSPCRIEIGKGFILMTCTALFAMKQRKSARRIAWESIVMLGIYITGLYVLYKGWFC